MKGDSPRGVEESVSGPSGVLSKQAVPTFSILIPTVGRSLLSKILNEIVPQLQVGDEVLVIGDGHQPEAQKIATGMDHKVHYYEYGPLHCWGHPQRNWAMPMAKGSYLMSLDDDDSFLPEAMDAVRKAALEFPNRPLLFRMLHGSGVLWRKKIVGCGNVSTQMFVVPNVKDRLGRWGERYEGDLDFIRSTALFYPEQERSIVWCTDIIAAHGHGGSDPRL